MTGMWIGSSMSLKQVLWKFIYYTHVLFQFCFIVWSFCTEWPQGYNSCALDNYAPYAENEFVYIHIDIFFSFFSWLKHYAVTTSMSLFLGLSKDKTNNNIIKLN